MGPVAESETLQQALFFRLFADDLTNPIYAVKLLTLPLFCLIYLLLVFLEIGRFPKVSV